MTSSNGNITRVTGPLCGEFTGSGEFPTQRPVTRSFDGFFYPRLNKRLTKQPWAWWFETPSWSLWRQCNGISQHVLYKFRMSINDFKIFSTYLNTLTLSLKILEMFHERNGTLSSETYLIKSYMAKMWSSQSMLLMDVLLSVFGVVARL